MESLLKEWDGETTIISYDKPTGAWIFIAIFLTRLGPAGGGTRMKPYPDVQSALQDALRLAEAMGRWFRSSVACFSLVPMWGCPPLIWILSLKRGPLMFSAAHRRLVEPDHRDLPRR